MTHEEILAIVAQMTTEERTRFLEFLRGLCGRECVHEP